MVDQAASGVPAKEGWITTLGALIYYHNAPVKVGQPGFVAFEELDAGKQEPYITLAAKVVVMLDQLGFAVVPKASVADQTEQARRNVDTLTEVIKEFVKRLPAKINKGYFPAEEMAIFILDKK